MRVAAPRRRQIVVGATAIALLALPLVATLGGQPFWITVATRILILALVATSLDFIVGYGGLVSFGHAAYFAAGAYTVAIAAFYGIDSAYIVWPLAVVAAGLLAAGVGALSLRTSGVFFIMITLAFAQMLFFLLIGIKYFGGDDGLSLTARSSLPPFDLRDPVTYYMVALAAFAAILYLSHRAVHSRFGTVLRAAKQNERRATALGFNVYRYRLVAFVLAGAAAGLGGALSASFERFANPEMSSWLQSGDLLVMVILGGVGTLLGPLFGAAAFILLQTVLIGLTEHWMVILGPVLIAVVLAGRRGIWGLLVGSGDE